MVGEILTICPTPGKKHIGEIARKIVSMYPLSFRDVTEDQVVGSGYDSLTKQLQTRLDNMKRGKTSLYLKRQTSSASEGEDPPSKIRRVERLPPGETEETQKCAKEELKKMHSNKSKNTKIIQVKMLATFYTQRSNMISGMETRFATRVAVSVRDVWDIMVHFKELTGMDVDRGAVSSKCERVILYLMSNEKNSNLEGIPEGTELAKAKHPDAYLPRCVMLLLKHFNEDQAKMFVMVDETCLPSEVDQLPSTPCVVVCGMIILFVSPI